MCVITRMWHSAPSRALYARMALVLVCLPSAILLEHVCEQVDQDVQGLRTQSLGHGTTQETGPGSDASSHSSLLTLLPVHRNIRLIFLFQLWFKRQWKKSHNSVLTTRRTNKKNTLSIGKVRELFSLWNKFPNCLFCFYE